MRRAAGIELSSPSLLLACLCVALVPCGADTWALDRDALAAGEWWRLWTAHVVHYSAQHALLDALVVAIFGRIAERGFGRVLVGATLFIAAAAVSLLCIAATGMREYRGASALAALLGVLAGAAVWRMHPHLRCFVVALGAAWFAKSLADAWLPQLTFTSLPAHVRVAWPAHLAGAGAALVALLVRAGCARRIRTVPTPPCAPARHSCVAAARASDGRSACNAGAI
jgi:membrane associated rhomboid family serine protease